jgi:glycosyltransferase involved in cell wall biosynthesis
MVFSIISDFSTTLAIRSPEFGGIARFFYYILVFIERFFRFWYVFMNAAYYDAVFLQRATFPFGLGRLLKLRKKEIVFDIDDAIFLPDTAKGDIITRFKAYVKETELKDVLWVSSCVIVENDYIKGYVSKYCQATYKIPGPIDTDRYRMKDEASRKGPGGPVIGWIGSPATTMYLGMLDGVFTSLLDKYHDLRIVLIGAGRYARQDDRIVRKEWRYDTEVEELQQFDVGIMPMPNDEWTRGKLGCKMLQYMAVGVPSVVSFTPTNAEIVKNGENGFLVGGEAEWLDTISRLIENEKLRNDVGLAGRRTVEQMCSVQKNAPKLVGILESLKGNHEIS